MWNKDEHFIFIISLPSLKLTIFLYLSPHRMFSKLLLLAVCPAHYKSLIHCSSVVRASDWFTEGHRFNIFLSQTRDIMNISFFYLSFYCQVKIIYQQSNIQRLFNVKLCNTAEYFTSQFLFFPGFRREKVKTVE